MLLYFTSLIGIGASFEQELETSQSHISLYFIVTSRQISKRSVVQLHTILNITVLGIYKRKWEL